MSESEICHPDRETVLELTQILLRVLNEDQHAELVARSSSSDIFSAYFSAANHIISVILDLAKTPEDRERARASMSSALMTLFKTASAGQN